MATRRSPSRRTRPSAQQLSIDDAIAHMPDAHLHCRDYGHVWLPHSARYVPDQRVYEQSLRCRQCKTIRRRLIGEHGNLISNRYDYVDHYLVSGVGRFDADMRSAVRLASILSTITPRGKSA